MNENILRALMQLFAIIAIVDKSDEPEAESETLDTGKSIVESFLKTELNNLLVNKYIDLFQEFLNAHHGASLKRDGVRKRTSLNSVKILRICTQINAELTQRQKIIVLLRIFEFIYANKRFTEQEFEFVSTVAETFNISTSEYNLIKTFVDKDFDFKLDEEGFLTISNTVENFTFGNHLLNENLLKPIRVLRIVSVNILLLRYFGNDELFLNGQVVSNSRCHIFNTGSTVKTTKINSIYYSDIITRFLADSETEKLVFRATDLEFKFNSGAIGLHKFTFDVPSGKLIGIMGGSGAGKSTIVNILNGNYAPTSGKVTINNIDVHSEKQKIEGVIGFVSQDDLLIEELTVFENLYFNARLCFKDLTKDEIETKVNELLLSIGLFDVKNLKVGNALDKTISGGQRKRLNISLELIREPGVLFLDEPTSGLSSRDSENIMDLLKELTLKGKLVFVVIHQPSSDIFKMFDKLLILDQGGYPIYNGHPIDAVVYFKTQVEHVNCDERECEICGNVNPEQIFNIIEAKIVDEYGANTSERKTTSEEWYDKYKKTNIAEVIANESSVPNSSFRIPGKRKQFRIYFLRDVRSKLTNSQYLALNFLEAPILAIILGFFVKFFHFRPNKNLAYSFFENTNIPAFLFISVVVALFIGLTLAAEEIIRDKKMLRREQFLNLSRGSYLMSKISVLFIISSFQTLTYVLVGNFILEIRGMWFEYWLILFSTSCFANMLGLNISSGFNSIKVIYLSVPILIIPQLLFSGVIVKFDKLHPWFAIQDEVPFIGNVMASRWSYEALAVTQYKHNEYESKLFDLKQIRSNSAWKRDYWYPAVLNKIDFLKNASKENKQEVTLAYEYLANEIRAEENEWGNLKCNNCLIGIEHQEIEKKLELSMELENFLRTIKTQYNKSFNIANDAINEKIKAFGEKNYALTKIVYDNEALSDYVTNHTEVDKLVEENFRFIQKSDPIYLEPKGKRFLDAHFYAPNKYFFGYKIDTFWANILVLWLMSGLLIISLYFDLLAKGLARLAKVFKSKKKATKN